MDHALNWYELFAAGGMTRLGLGERGLALRDEWCPYAQRQHRTLLTGPSGSYEQRLTIALGPVDETNIKRRKNFLLILEER